MSKMYRKYLYTSFSHEIMQYLYKWTITQLAYYTVRHKKLHHFVFAITLSYLSLFEYLLVHIYRDKFGTN